MALTLSPQGLLARKDYPDGHFVTFGYDAHRNLVQTVAVTGTTRLTTTLAYDGGDQLTRITYPTGRFVAYTYDSSGRPRSPTRAPTPSPTATTPVLATVYLSVCTMSWLHSGMQNVLATDR